MTVVQVIQEMEEYPPTGIKVIVVGSGFAGLACAIESQRKGHKVILVEKSREFAIPGTQPILVFFLSLTIWI